MIPVSYNIRSLTVRKTTTLVTAFGIALVVFVLATSLMLGEGIRKTVGSSGSPDVAIVLRKGSDAEISSSMENPTVGLIRAIAGVKRGTEGTGQGVGELVVVATMDKVGTTGVANVTVRGVPEDVFAFRTEAKIIAGRAPRSGTDEVAVGSRIRGRFKGLELGQTFAFRKNRPAKVVGIFEARGSAYESEVWGDLETIRAAFGREGLVSSVRVRLESPAKYTAFEAVVEQDKQLGLEAMREFEFYEKQSEATSRFVVVLGTVIAIFFSIGAMIGAMITMYGSVSTRQRELGTLRALGFSRTSILGSFLLESTLLALIGGLFGALASLSMGAVKLSMMNFATWSEVVFSFSPTPNILGTAVLFGCVMGIVGGFFPALRAARVSPIEAMRS